MDAHNHDNYHCVCDRRGHPGRRGSRGKPGPNGFQGINGFTNADLRGSQGPNTIISPTNGTQGFHGFEGEASSERGMRGSQGEIGFAGDVDLEKNFAFLGPQGSGGPMGHQGLTGKQGNRGPQAAVASWDELFEMQGERGAQGDQGFNGEYGFTGAVNDLNATQGVQGPQGETGIQGPQNTRVMPNVQGFPGPQGYTGSQSTGIGLTGTSGTQGYMSNITIGAQGFVAPFTQASVGGPGPLPSSAQDGLMGTQGSEGPVVLSDPILVSLSNDAWTNSQVFPTSIPVTINLSRKVFINVTMCIRATLVQTPAPEVNLAVHQGETLFATASAQTAIRSRILNFTTLYTPNPNLPPNLNLAITSSSTVSFEIRFVSIRVTEILA